MKRIVISVASVLFCTVLMSLACSCKEDEHGFVVPTPDPDKEQEKEENEEEIVENSKESE